MEARPFAQFLLVFCFHIIVAVNAEKLSVEVGYQGTVRRHVQEESAVSVHTNPGLNCDPTPIDLSFCDANGQPRQFYSNLRGKGPHTGKPNEFRVKGVAVVDGTTLDLVVEVAADSSYHSWRQDNNVNRGGPFVDGCFAAIPIEVRTGTKFNFKLVKQNDVTNSAYNVKQLRLSVLDFDQETDRDHEYTLLNTPAYAMKMGSNVREQGLQDGTVKLQSIVMGKERDNPKGLPLTNAQVDKAVEFGYKDVSSWSLTLGHEGGHSSRDRVFMFSGSIISKCPAVPTKINYSLCDGNGKPRPFHSNLAGKGPHSYGKAEFRIFGVAVVGGTTLDLVLKVATDSGYKSWRQDNNANGGGAYVDTGCRVAIPIEVRTSTKFQWMFVKQDDETDQPYNVNGMRLSILDFDQETDRDHEYVLLNTPASSMQKGNSVHELVLQDGTKKLQSVVMGKTKDNPKGLTLTAAQAEKTVEVGYDHVSSWYLTFGHEGGSSSRDRVFFFAPSFSTR